jgi:hypothetical protein
MRVALASDLEVPVPQTMNLAQNRRYPIAAKIF